MAGVPGQTPEQKLAYAKAVAGPKGTVREEQREGITDYIPVPLRNKDQSVLNTVSHFADKYLGFGDDRRRSRLLSGVASQWYGLDEGGNPSAGATPGIVYETKALGALPTMLARSGMDAYLDWVAQKFGGYPPGKVLEDPLYQLVRKEVLSDPEFATNAAAKADQIHQAVRQDMRLKAPKGFQQNFDESMGVMLGQLPIPGKLATKAVEGAEAAPGVLRRLEQGAEWFTPTVEPKASNYLTGAVTGGALGTLGDEEDTPVVVPGDQPGEYNVRPVYSDSSVGYSGSDEDQAALAQAQEEENQHADGGPVKDLCSGGVSAVASMRAKYAEGGKVNTALKAIKDAIAHLDNGNTSAALQTLQSSPEALRDPGIAAAMAKLRSPLASRAGRRQILSRAAEGLEAPSVALAEGGKVSVAKGLVEQLVKDALREDNPQQALDGMHDMGNISSRDYEKASGRVRKILAQGKKPAFAGGGKVSAVDALVKKAAGLTRSVYFGSLQHKGANPRDLAHAHEVADRLGVKVVDDEGDGHYNLRIGTDHAKKFKKEGSLTIKNRKGDQLDMEDY